MANKGPSSLTAASALGGTEVVHGVQSSNSRKITMNQIKTLALAVFGANGIIARTAAETFSARTITGTANEITVTNGSGEAGNPTLALHSGVYRAGGTDVALADGGTGASTAAGARTNLGLVIGTDVLGMGGGTLTGDLSVPDEAYGVGWDGSVEVPTKNALYDKIETLGGAVAWALAGTGQTATGVYDQAVDGSKANVDFAGLGSFNELLIVGRLLTSDTSGVRVVRVSVDGGSTFYAASTDYATLDASGVENGSTGFAHSTATTAARSIIVQIVNTKGAAKVGIMQNGTGVRTLFVASASDIDAIRVTNSGGGNITGGTVRVYAR